MLVNVDEAPCYNVQDEINKNSTAEQTKVDLVSKAEASGKRIVKIGENSINLF